MYGFYLVGSFLEKAIFPGRHGWIGEIPHGWIGQLGSTGLMHFVYIKVGGFRLPFLFSGGMLILIGILFLFILPTSEGKY